MRSVSRSRPADHVRPALGDARVSRMWSSIAATERARLQRRAPRGRIAAILAAAAVIAALVLLVALRLRSSTSESMAGLVMDTGATSQQVSLPEGSVLQLGPATRLRVLAASAEEVRLRLEHGRVLCDVTHREGRRFVVEAERVEVEVRGTKFDVEVDPDPGVDPQRAVAVHVERGAVDIHDDGHALVASLTPGQSWQSRARAVEVPEPAPTSAPAPEPTAAPAPTSSEGVPRGGALSPRALFDRANAARLAGRNAEAAADFDRFYRRFPNDPRAGLAAYELGRIRLGSLHDPRGAAEAFAVVLDRAPGDSFREDAEVGRIEALANLDDAAACRQARDAFLARNTASPHARRVSLLCGAR